jgi:hypothetical protein
MEQGKTDGLAIDKGEQRLEMPLRSEAIATQTSSVATTALGARS